MKTAFNASKLAIAAFIVPYIFALNPAMLLIDTSAFEIVLLVVTSLVGMFGVASALNGFLLRRLDWPVRLLLAAGGLLMMDPQPLTDIIGFVLLGACLAWQKWGRPFGKASAA